MVDNGIILIKYWLNVSVDEQTRRLENRIEDPRKIWKLSPTDLKSYSRHYDYCRARDAMFAATDTGMGAVVRRGQRRQEARPAQHHLPPAQPDPVRSRCRPKTSRCPGSRRARGYAEPICRCTTSRRPSRGADRTRTTTTENEGLAMTDKTVVSSTGEAPAGAGGAAEKWYALSPDEVAQRARGRPRQRPVRREGRGAADDERPERAARREAAARVEAVPGAVQVLHADHPRRRRRSPRSLIGEIATGIAVLLITALNALGGLRQQGKAESAMNALQSMLKTTARVRRDGTEVKVDADQVVVGDVVLLAAGDDVCADGRLIEATSLQIDESALTGESVPASKSTEVDHRCRTRSWATSRTWRS